MISARVWRMGFVPVLSIGMLVAAGAASAEGAAREDSAVTVPDTAADVDPATRELLRGAARDLLSERTSALVDGKQRPAAGLASGRVMQSAPLASRARKDITALVDRREDLREAGEAYTAANVDVKVLSSTADGDRVTLKVKETTTLTYAKLRGDEPPDTRFSVRHTFVFEKSSAGSWLLVSEDADSTGIPAVNEVREVDDDSVGLKSTPDESTGDESTGDEVPAQPGSSPPGQEAEKSAGATGAARTVEAMPAVASYDYPAMARYAERYWTNYNPAYRSFSDVGGDCTNFISQSLRAGGWANDSGATWDCSNWFYGRTNQSRSWVNVNCWASFAIESRRARYLTRVNDLGIGDILQMDFTGNGTKDHSMITTYKANGIPYLTYHTEDTYRRSTTSLVNSFPRAIYYAFRT